MKSLSKAAAALAAVLAARGASADVRLASVFTDGAVLQAGVRVPVWGAAAPGERVTVGFGTHKAAATAGADGRWRVILPPMECSDEGRELAVAGRNRIVLEDVLVGEVWLGIGQSNMEFPFDNCEYGKRASKGGTIPPTVRYFHLPKDGDEKPRDMFAVPEGTRWRAYTAENERENRRSSMLLAHFAERLSRELGVPVGVIGAAVGGANLESWMSAEAIADADMVEEAAKLLKTCEGWHANDVKRWQARPESEKNRPCPRINYESRPTQVWNAMVPPLAPYAVRGIIWYQGEMNSGWQKYEKQFPFFAKRLRAAFETGDRPLYIVQLPDFRQEHWVRIRDVQRKMSESVPGAELVVAIDGDELELHPRDKTRLASRLANLALADCYGRRIVARSPAPAKAAAKGGLVRVAFRNAGEGLRTRDGAEPRTFELVESGDKGVQVRARIASRNVVELAVPDGLAAPTRVRYAWSPDPDVNLVNSADLPATPFEIEIEKQANKEENIK